MIAINEIAPGSLGEEAGFVPGDRICTINGQEVKDLIDFQVHSSEQHLLIEVEREGELYEVEVEREPNDVFGLDFGEMKLRSCNNKCVFCFIHQMPKGLRRSLYFEDDDYRLSFLHGSYVTLTNIKEKDIDRIIEQGLSPQFISVHATDPQVRQIMLGRELPVDILQRIAKLAAHGIEMHAQVVVCPEWNDGEHLECTVRDLSRYYPQVRSVALVPVGLTRFRQNLPQLQPVTGEYAKIYLGQAEKWGTQFQRELGERFVYAADELFLLNGAYPPEGDYYDAFPQVENGIGMLRQFLDTWEMERRRLPSRIAPAQNVGIITGKLGRDFMMPIVADLNEIDGLSVDLLDVENDFFGHGITVSGLLAGKDILKRIESGSWDMVFLPPNCINGQGLTIDDMTVAQLSAAASLPLTVGDYSLASCLEAYLHEARVAVDGRGRQLSELGYYIGHKK